MMTQSNAGLAAVGSEWYEQVVNFGPAVPATLEETGLSQAFISDLLLKVMYMQGTRTGDELAGFIRLPFAILDDELLSLQGRRLVEVRGTQGRGRRGYAFELTSEGRARCREIMRTSSYVGPAPVPLDQYRVVVARQGMRDAEVDPEQLQEGFRHLVLDEAFIDSFGPAINSGRSLFLYGHAGNGKTSLAEAIAEMVGDAIYLPYSLEIQGQVITVYDPIVHQPADEVGEADPGSAWIQPIPNYDPRWMRIRRPVVMVGGELTLEDLELQWDRMAGVFRAPPQVKANGGVFIIDDFGRQRIRPRDLLNRWMVPLEKHVDFLGLPMGHKLPVPFECLLIFATNLDPTELVEEAFLRRIRYKILVDNPTREHYAEIFRRACESRGIAFAQEAVDLVYDEYYSKDHLHARSCHPRDIANHLCDIARYHKRERELTEELLRQSCDAYFLDMPERVPRAPGGEGEDGHGGLSHWRGRGRFDGSHDPGVYDG